MKKRFGESKKQTKVLSIVEGGFYGVHEGVGIKYVAPFALAIGKGSPYITTFIALLTSIPPLVGNITQLYANSFMKKYRRKELLTFFVMLQSLFWMGVLACAMGFFVFGWDSTFSLIALTLCYTALTSCGSFVSPVWTSLMKDIVSTQRGNYFSRRNRIAGGIALITSLFAGAWLDKVGVNHLLVGFGTLFLCAFLFRFISGFLFLFHDDPPFKVNGAAYFTFWAFIRRYKESNFVKFALFISFFILAVSLSGPFFVIYMLEDLHFSYLTWTIITIAGSLSSLFFMSFWGDFIDAHGSVKTLKITGVLISLIPFLWMFSYYFDPAQRSIVFFLVAIEFFSGCVWAGFNLSFSNFIYDAVRSEKTHLCSAYFNLLHGLGVFFGSAIGSIILYFDIHLLFMSSFFFVLFLSGIMRFFAYALLVPQINEVREVKNFSFDNAMHKFSQFHLKPFIDVFNLKIIKPIPNWI